MDKKQLQNIIPVIAAKMKFRPAIIEKDYYLTMILNHAKDIFEERIVFKLD